MDLDDLDPPKAIVPMVTGLARAHQLRDRVMEKASEVVEGVMGFADLSTEELGVEEPPERWVSSLGLEAARKKFTYAKMGYATASQAPVAVKVASSTLNGMMKAMASEKAATQTFNAVIIQMPSAAPPMEEIIVTVKE